MVKRVLLVLLVGGVVGACASQVGMVRDGETYGVTKGVFRGRWWSYYERGCSYLSGAFYAEAEADFKQALVGRTRDAWQARTYGLHFVEYFPNRELGVAYYHLGQLDLAAQYLETSLSQLDTARAHHYLDLVAKAKIAKGELEDTAAPSLDTSIHDGIMVAVRDVPVRIQASDDLGVFGVCVNGDTLPQRGSAEAIAFEDRMLLTEGAHEVCVQVYDLAGKETAETVTVQVDLTGPTIGLFSPKDALVTEAASVTLEGTCVDANGVVSVALGERTLAESQGGKRLDFTAELPLTDGENAFVVAAKDVAGNETRTAIKVFKGKPDSAAARLWFLHERAPHLLQFAAAGGRNAVNASLLSALVSAAAEEDITIALKSPKADRPYRHNKVLRVSGEVTARTKVASLTINGAPFEPLTGAPKEVFTKGLSIDDETLNQGEAKLPLAVHAQDDAGNEATEEFEVTVHPVLLDSEDSKMPVAVMPFAGVDVEEADTVRLRNATESRLFEDRRFSIVDRTQLDQVLVEQQLAAAGLANAGQAIQVGKLVNAHVIVVADVLERGQKGIEIHARAISTETSKLKAVLDAFVPDKGNPDEIEAGCRAIAHQLAQAFPRLSGELVGVRDKQLLLNWTKEDGIQEDMYMLVVYETDPWVDDETGEVLAEGEVALVARGIIKRVQAANSLATVKEHIEQETGEVVDIEKGMAAVTM